MIERTPLARLIADEHISNRRRANVKEYGISWIKPPGVTKTLYQMREEKREQEEHQEAMRREELARELEEANGAATLDEGAEPAEENEEDGQHDLDDDIPDADDEFGMHDGNDDEEDEDATEEEEEDDDGQETDESVLREERQNDIMAARMRMNDDAFREALVRGDPDAGDMYGEEEDPEDQMQGNILDEDDFGQEGTDDGLGMDMDADLDDDIPEADSGGYEHTDSEAELSSSEEEQSGDDVDISYAPRSATLPQPASPTLHGASSASHPRASMDLSNLLSQDGSSFMDSSPAGRRARHG